MNSLQGKKAQNLPTARSLLSETLAASAGKHLGFFISLLIHSQLLRINIDLRFGDLAKGKENY
jgi:hypothetical protein